VGRSSDALEPPGKIAQTTLDIASQDVSKKSRRPLADLDAVAAYIDSGTGAGNQAAWVFDSTTRYIGLQLALPISLGVDQLQS